MSLGVPGITVEQFYSEKIFNSLQEQPAKLESAFLGKSKDSLDRVDLCLELDAIIPTFGPFLRFYTSDCHLQPLPPVVNAFSVMMSSQRQQQQPRLPSYVPVRTRKDELYNDVLQMLNEENLLFIDVIAGKNFVKTLVECLWYLDGHHETLKKQSSSVPEYFSRFVGYNLPEVSKHRKRQASNLSSVVLKSLASTLFQNLEASFWSDLSFRHLQKHTRTLAQSLANYSEYLSSQNKTMKHHHALPLPVRQLSDALSIKYLKPCGDPEPLAKFNDLIAAIDGKEDFEQLFLNDFTPTTAMSRYQFLQSLERNGISSPVVLLTHSSGNNAGNLHFIWKVPVRMTVEECFQNSLAVIERVKALMPQFHTRAMRKAMYEKFGRVSSGVKPKVLRVFYRDLTGDCSASHDLPESIVDERVREILTMELEDPRTLVDLREVKHPELRSKFDVFWEEAHKYINEDLGAAVDDRRHGEVTHLAKAISIRDLREQVSARCPPDTAVPSEEWLRLQFWPKTPKACVSLHYTGRLNVRFMVQKRQFRKAHEDEHYAAAIFRYMREYAIKMKEFCTLVCIDDKHKLKVGEPGCPVAAAERGKRVLVRAGTTFEVGDHDFTKFSITPSVILAVDIPDNIQESWYRGQVFVGYKDAAFEPSSPMRHAAELSSVLNSDSVSFQKPVLFVYSDGGPDHRLTYVSVQVSLIALFLQLDLDFLCAGRTAPAHSWKNPVERVMSTLNLGLQCVGLMRETGSSDFEAEAAKCNSLAALRGATQRMPNFRAEALDSIAHVKSLLVMLLQRLELKEKKFSPFFPATEEQIDLMWQELLKIDSTLKKDESLTKKELASKEDLKVFIEHCCTVRHYTFQIKKCGSLTCSICKPVRLPQEVFDSMHILPDPVPGEDGHFKSFEDLLGTKTDEQHRPSIQRKPRRKKTLPFSASVQHVKNVDLMLQCDECGMWRLLYSKLKLTKRERSDLQVALEDVSFSCGASLQDLQLPGRLDNVYARELSCGEPIEKLYYSAKYSPICVYCACDMESVPKDKYPQCSACSSMPAIPK